MSLSPEAILALGILQARPGRALTPSQVETDLRSGGLARIIQLPDQALKVRLWLDPEALMNLDWPPALEGQLADAWRRWSSLHDRRRGHGEEVVELLIAGSGPESDLARLCSRLRRVVPNWILVTPVWTREGSRQPLGPHRDPGRSRSLELNHDDRRDPDRGYSAPAQDSDSPGRPRTQPRSRRLGSQAETSASTPPGRHLQTQVFSREATGLEQRIRSFSPGRTHVLRVRIGRIARDWLAAGDEFPEHKLPPDREVHTLTVTLHAPQLLPAPLSQPLVLPRTSDSTVVDFELEVPATAAAVEALLIVYHGNTPLQAAKLKGPVVAAHLDFEGPGIELELGEASAVDLAHTAGRDLTIFQDGDQLTLRWSSGERSRDVSFPLEGVENVVANLRGQLVQVAGMMDEDGSGFGEGQGLKLLRTLAEQGEYLRRLLLDALYDEVEGFDHAELEQARTVHAWSPSSKDGFPVEFLYDLPLPDEDAKLCTGFLATPREAEACSSCAASDSSRFICPFGFWGLNRFIERQVRPWGKTDRLAPESSDAQPTLAPVEELIFAASAQVDLSREGAIAKTVEDLQRITGGKVYPAASWEQWKQLVEAHSHALLVALPHNVPTAPGFRALEIAAGERLPLNRVGTEHVSPARGRSNPVFLLLGCRTAAAEVGYQDFVAKFRRSGAAIVVATLAEVIGHQAAATARTLVELLWQRRRDAVLPFGEVMRQLRVEMVKAGNPVGLALVAFGDADWRLAPPEVS